MPEYNSRQASLRCLQCRVRFCNPYPANIYRLETADAKEEKDGGIRRFRNRLDVGMTPSSEESANSLLTCCIVDVLLA